MNYAMDQESQVFSHQIEVVNCLANKFENITVLTAHCGNFQVSKNVRVVGTNWVQGKKTKSLFKFYRRFFEIILTNKISVIFSHMTSVQSAFTSPITKIMGVKHYLWYAHTSSDIYFRVAKVFTSGIITSTSGSCPVKGKNIFPIGQAIDKTKFRKKSTANYPLYKFVHIGRLDPSKNIEEIIQVVSNFRNQNSNITLEIVGSPSSKKYFTYANELMARFHSEEYRQWIKFTPKLPRKLVSEVLQEKDCFIHAFQGSLDKSIVEATFVGLPVITLNREYLKIFGEWSDYKLNNRTDLQTEADSLMKLNKSNLDSEIERRYLVAIEQHELQTWIVRLVNILKFGYFDSNRL
jgi:glycosyltransferase involved in cell wall biosynthesis